MSTEAEQELQRLARKHKALYAAGISGSNPLAVSRLIDDVEGKPYLRDALLDVLATDAIRKAGPDPIPDTAHSMERELPAMLHWNWSKGYHGDPDTPDDPPHLEDVAVMLGEHDITDLLSPEQLADVREAMLRDMEAGQ